MREKLVSVLAALFEVLVLASSEVRRGRVRAYFKQLFGSESPVGPALESLKLLTLGEERQVVADTYGGVSRLNTKTDRIETIITEVNQGVQSLRSEHRERSNLADVDKLRRILVPSPFPDDFYNAFKKSTVPGTGDWILEDEGLNAWLRGEKPYLWISGNAGQSGILDAQRKTRRLTVGKGTGKSYLTARIIAWRKETMDRHTSVGYFFFRANNPETRSVLQALRDVAYQLSESDAFYAKDLMQRLHSRNDIKTVASAFRQLFSASIGADQVARTKYVFLDGIDEADKEEVKELLSILAPTQQPACAPHFQFALIGRSYVSDDVTLALDLPALGQALNTVQVTPDRNAKDVNAFIYDSVLHSRVLNRTSVDFKTKVIEALEKQADGLFIVAKFMLDDVNRKRHQSSILASLESYPKEIDGVLQKTLENLSKTIHEDDARDLNEMLRWVACAEEVLTLEQLESALTMKFKDPPLVPLEESIRGQYACFFELEREDGLTTDDLVKDLERARRDLSRDLSPARRMSTGRSLSVGEASNPPRRLSAAGRGSLSRHSSPGTGQLSPTRQLSPGHGSDVIIDAESDTGFRSNKSTTRVTFFHTSVREFFRSGHAAKVAPSDSDGWTVGFDIHEARIHILRTCLKVFIGAEWFQGLDLGHGKEAMRQYAAWYWQEHVAAIDPATVSRDDKRELGPQLYKMLTDENTILDWSIMYEKNDEGLEVLTDGNIEGLRRWFSDSDVVESLTPEAKAFAKQSTEKGSNVCEAIGRLYAKAWLSGDFEQYVPTLFCFKIVQNVAFMDAGYEWSHANVHWPDISIEERVAKATGWAAHPETAHWHRRVGSTYLTLGMHTDALKHYDAALKMDHNSVETSGRIAYCLFREKRYGAALEQALECAAIEELDAQDAALREPALRNSRWRLYKDYYLVAQCSYHTGKVDLAHEYFHKAIKSAADADLSQSEFLEPETGYLEVLAAESLDSEVMELVEEMSRHVTGNKHGQSRFVELLLEKHNSPLVMDWIPKAASKTGKSEFLLERLELAMNIADTMRYSLAVLCLRLAVGTTCAYSRNVDEAMLTFEQISLLEYRPRGSIPTRLAYAASFQKLAALYKQKALHGGLETPEATGWIAKLEAVQQRQDEHRNFNMPANMLGSDVNAASIYLASFYRRLGRESDATALLKSLFRDSLDLLSDAEPLNDVFALENLLRIFIAADDVPNAQALARSMRRVNPEASIGTTPGDSPTERRGAPKLPDIQAHERSCFQCFDAVPAWDEFAVCRHCMECFCGRCLDKVIRRPGNRTGDGDGRVVCRSDHEWFTVLPLNRFLHTGEVMLEDGRVQGFAEWRDGVRRRWEAM